MNNILEVGGLTVRVKEKRQSRTLVENVMFSVRPGRCLGILGESGSGKSMTCKAITGLLDSSFQVSGQALFNGKKLIGMDAETLRRIRGREICMILQNPMNCFDPLHRMGKQMAEGFEAHTALPRAEVRQKCVATLENMRIRNPEEVLMKYPHQLSGGMLQRVMIGLALIMEPKLIIADEPTTAIDSITQYSIVEELKMIKSRNGAAMIFISHDLAVISQIADEVIVMRDAKICQSGSVQDVMLHPTDEYTRFLIQKKKAVMQKFYQVVSA